MNMVNGMGGGNTMQTLYQMQQDKQVNEPAKPALNTWKCSCGAENTGKFCAECGNPKPVADVWKCANCGTENKGKFCSECGSPKPSKLVCGNCGAEAANPNAKFCPECGTPYNK